MSFGYFYTKILAKRKLNFISNPSLLTFFKRKTQFGTLVPKANVRMRNEWNQAYLKFKFFNKISDRIIKISETPELSKRRKGSILFI